MSIWQKIVTGTKFLFGGFDSAVDYLLNVVLNPYLTVETVAAKVKRAYEVALSVYGMLMKYADYCPACWRKYYDAVLTSLDAMVETFADGIVEREEIANVISAVQTARLEWNKD